MSTIGVKKIQYPDGPDILTLDSSGSITIADSATVGGILDVTGDLTVDTNTFHVDTSNNRVGIGNDSPSTTLHVRTGTATNKAGYRSGTTGVIVEGTTGSYLQFVADNDAPMGILFDGGTSTSDTARGGYLYDRNHSIASLHLKSGGTTRMGIAEDGTVVFFQDGSNEKLRIHTNGNISSNVTGNLAGIYVSRGLNSYNTILLNNSVNNTGGIFLNMTNHSGSGIGSISQASETSVAFNTSSDYRLKENVNYTFDATTELKKLKPCKFNFIGDSQTIEGFLAHEVQDIIPIAITGKKDGTVDLGTIKDKDGKVIDEDAPIARKEDGQTWTKTKTENVYQGIDQSKLVPLLVKTIQELEARIAVLESK